MPILVDINVLFQRLKTPKMTINENIVIFRPFNSEFYTSILCVFCNFAALKQQKII